MKRSEVKPFRILRGKDEVAVVNATSPLAALSGYAAEHNLAGVQQGRTTLAVVGVGLLRAVSAAICGCGPRTLADVYWDADNTCRCRRCRLPIKEGTGRDAPVLSDRQLALLRYLCVSGRASATAIRRAGYATTTVESVIGLGLVERRVVGARGSMYHLTKFGRDSACVQDDDLAVPGSPQSSRPAGSLTTESEVHTMTTATENQTTETPAAEAATTTAAKKASADKTAEFQPLFKELLKEVKAVARGTKEVKKSNYVRVTLDSKTVAYVNLPNSKGVKVSIPKKGGSGYDDIKATTESDVPKVMTAVKAHVAAITEVAAA